MPIDRPPVTIKGKSLVYARPELMTEPEFRVGTNDGKLRNESPKGLGDEADAATYRK